MGVVQTNGVTALWELTATELARALRAGELSASEVLESSLARIAETNPRCNAIVSLDAEAARQTAARLDRLPAERRGPLHGMPIAVKDLEDTAGLRTTYGSPLFADHVPDADSIIVQRLRAAGAVIVGKTNTPEWGAGSQTFNPVFGATRNPWDLTRTPGGSSGGAGAAVAAGMVPFADGSDFGGSIRNPAGFCGLVGLRPSPGRVPALSGDPYSPLAVLGPIARTAADAALLLSAIAGPDPRDPLSRMWPHTGFGSPDPDRARDLRIAWSPDLGDLPVSGDVTDVLEGQARPALRATGCQIVDTAFALPLADTAFEVLRGVGFVREFGALVDAHPDQVKATVAENVAYGRALTGADVARGIAARTASADAMRARLADVDALALPTAQVAPFAVETEWPAEIDGRPQRSYLEWMRACSRITVTGHPAISVPGGVTADGLPVGLQLVGREGAEATLLAIAAALERETGFAERRPPLR